MAVTEFTSKMEKYVVLILRVISNLENQLQCTAELISKSLKDLVFVLIVFITAGNMSCIYIKQQMLDVNENSACTFHIRWNE